jgi:serine/threonine protein kinase
MIGHCKKQTINGFEFIILTELMKCDLEDLIRNEPNLTNLQRVAISTGIARGMKRIHDTGFIHRDIKPANILITVNNVPKLADMGIARLVEGDKTYLIGPLSYMPPEFYSKPLNYTNKLDVFSFGLTINELFGGRHEARLGNEMLNIVITKECNCLIWNYIIIKCIDQDPTKRYSSMDIEEAFSCLKDCLKNENELNFDRNITLSDQDVKNFKIKSHNLTGKIIRLKDYFGSIRFEKTYDKKVREHADKIWDKCMCVLQSCEDGHIESVYPEWEEEEKIISIANDPILAYLNFNLIKHEINPNRFDLVYIITLLFTMEYYYKECEDWLNCIRLSDICLDACIVYLATHH